MLLFVAVLAGVLLVILLLLAIQARELRAQRAAAEVYARSYVKLERELRDALKSSQQQFVKAAALIAEDVQRAGDNRLAGAFRSLSSGMSEHVR